MVSMTFGYNQLPTFVQRNLLLLTILSQESVATPSKLGFETIGRVIESGMQDTAVPSACMQAAIGLFFKQMHRCVGEYASKSSSNI